jgi:hypothetical protein
MEAGRQWLALEGVGGAVAATADVTAAENES